MNVRNNCLLPLLLIASGVGWQSFVQGSPRENTMLGLPQSAIVRDAVLAPAKAALGKKLFFDTHLSSDESISCANCHQPQRAFTDGKVLAEGVGMRIGTRNAPSLLNVVFNTTLFWDGRRPSLETQALDPLVNPREQGLKDYEAVLNRLRSDQTYVAAFRAAFSIEPSSIRIEHVGTAIASFERTLVAGDSPFDRYYFANEQSAMSPSAQRGLALFQGAARCSTCHTIDKQFALFTDNAFHSLNVGLQRIASHLAELTTRLVAARQAGASLDHTITSEEDLAELGRFAVTLSPADIGKFRTPSLRNVALTAPYMHDGSVATLKDAVELELYNRGAEAGRPLILTPLEKANLVEFLKALSSPVTIRFAQETEK